MSSQPLAGHPLHGKRVIELGTMIAAPFATHILASLGAEVIKIEPPSGDTTRAWCAAGRRARSSPIAIRKKAICLDLTTDGGKEVFLQARRQRRCRDPQPRALAPRASWG